MREQPPRTPDDGRFAERRAFTERRSGRRSARHGRVGPLPLPSLGSLLVLLVTSSLLVTPLVAALATPASAQVASNVTGRPNVDVFLPENRLVPGTETTLRLFFSNDGELFSRGPDEFEALVQTARRTTVEVRSGDAPIEVLTAETPIGTVPPGVTGPVAVRVRVDADAEPGSYNLPVRVRYEYTDRVKFGTGGGADFFEEEEELRPRVTVRIEDRARFETAGVTGGVPVGESGPLTLALRNAGAEAARDATVRLQSADSEVTFGAGAPAAESFVGDWAAGETRPVPVRVRFADDALVREYTLQATVTYRTPDGRTVQSDPVVVGVRPASGPVLELAAVAGDLRAGEEGIVRGTVANRGDVPARQVVVRVAADGPALSVAETAYPLGTLAPGATGEFAVPIDVDRDADAGPRRLTVTIERRAVDDSTRTETADATVGVAAARDPFTVEGVNASFAVDSSGTLVVRVTNAGDEPVRDVRVRMTAEPPFESEAPAGFVPALAPGESADVAMHLDVVSEAVPGTNAVSVVLSYEDAAGDDRETLPYQVPVEVVPEPAGNVLLPAAVAVLAVLGFGVWYWRRR